MKHVVSHVARIKKELHSRTLAGLFGSEYYKTQALAALLRRKYCLRFLYKRKFYYQLRNVSTSKSFAQNLGRK